MPRAASPKGTCRCCERELTRRGAARHLSACSRRRSVVEQADAGKGRPERLYHVRVRDGWDGLYWLDLEVRGGATLGELDGYLRRIWLECCDHMSQFSVGRWRGEEIPMSARIGAVLGGGVELTHIYDFGTESITLVKAVVVRTGLPTTSHPIALMARNEAPVQECDQCIETAEWLCLECLTEHKVPGALCADHTRAHPCQDYGEPVPILNSPRLGMCGYTGPADPPY